MSLRDAAVYSCLKLDAETSVLGPVRRGWNPENGRFIPSIGGLVRIRACMHCKSLPAFPCPAPAFSRWRSTPGRRRLRPPPLAEQGSRGNQPIETTIFGVCFACHSRGGRCVFELSLGY